MKDKEWSAGGKGGETIRAEEKVAGIVAFMFDKTSWRAVTE